MLPKEAIEEFKTIYRKVFNEEIYNEEALVRANKLIDLYRAIFGSLTQAAQRKINTYEPRTENNRG
jgi:hypothetical protein